MCQKMTLLQYSQSNIGNTMLDMTISCYLHVKMRFLDRATYRESTGEKTKSIAPSVAELYVFEVLLIFLLHN
jgi:hypothetical protein